ncbi:unnamed protein product [Mytilus edulis]|uniref:Uncharacterized protein n=1 Tax=Mytilus edulis TaxID=6550 RepID=A0A8S3RKQ5_MYTED|nr:unnamed protein product [Mytilus edulis]
MYYEYADIKFKQVRSSTSQQLPRSDLTIRSSSNYDETLKMKETLGEDSPSISDNSTTLLKVNVTPRNEENDLNNQCSDAESLQSRDTNCLEFHFFPGELFLVKWETFPSMIPHGNQPNIYQPAHVIDDFHQPEVSEECLLAYSDILEEAIQSRLELEKKCKDIFQLLINEKGENLEIIDENKSLKQENECLKARNESLLNCR